MHRRTLFRIVTVFLRVGTGGVWAGTDTTAGGATAPTQVLLVDLTL